MWPDRCVALVSVGIMIARYHTVGDEVETPTGPNTWKVTLTVHGHAEPGAHLHGRTTRHPAAARPSREPAQRATRSKTG